MSCRKPSRQPAVTRLLLGLGFLANLLVTAGLPAAVPAMPGSIAYPEQRPAFEVDDLQGKVAVVVFYQSWCGICNGWSPELFDQLTKAYGDDRRVALVAIKTDEEDPAAAVAYLEERTDSDGWLIAADPGAVWYQAVTGQKSLYEYAIIGPDGKLVETGEAGSYYPKGKSKKFVLPTKKLPLAKATTVLPADRTYPPELRRAVTAAEAGDHVLALTLAKQAGAVGKKLSSDLLGILGERTDTWIGQLSEDHEMPTRLDAFLALRDLVEDLPGSPMAERAEDPLRDFKRDRAVKDELRALEAWHTIHAKAAKVPAEQREQAIAAAMKKLAKRYDDTVYGRKAADW